MQIRIISQHVPMGLHLLKINLSMCSIHMIPNSIWFALDHEKMNDQKLVGLMHVFSRRSQLILDRFVPYFSSFFYTSITHSSNWLTWLLRLLLLLLLLLQLVFYPHAVEILMIRGDSLNRKRKIWTSSVAYIHRYLACQIYICISIENVRVRK